MHTVEAGASCSQFSNLQTSQPLEGHFSRNTPWPKLLLSLHLYPTSRGCSLNSQQSTPPCHNAAHGQLIMQYTIARRWLVLSASEVQVLSDLHKQKCFPPGVKPKTLYGRQDVKCLNEFFSFFRCFSFKCFSGESSKQWSCVVFAAGRGFTG